MTWCINYQPSQKTPRASQPHTALCPTKALSGHLIRYQTSILPTHRKNKLCQKKSSHTNSITDYCYRLMPAKSLISAQADKRPWAPLFTQSYCLSPRIKKNFGPTSSYHRSPPPASHCTEEGKDSGYNLWSTGTALQGLRPSGQEGIFLGCQMLD